MNRKLTGKKRFKIWKKKIVLQVQYSYLEITKFGDGETYYFWRDATIQDFSEFSDFNCINIKK